MRIARYAACLLAVATLLVMVSHPGVRAGSRHQQPQTTYTGTIVTMFTVTIQSTGLPTTKGACAVRSSLTDDGNEFKELAETTMKVSGDTGSCTVDLPYSWTLSDGGSDSVTLEFDVAVPLTVVTSNSAPARYSQRTITIAMPANGATTDESVDVTI